MKTNLLLLFLHFAGIVLGQGCFLSSNPTVISGTTNTSGNANIDNVTIKEFQQLLNIFPVRPNFMYLNENGSPNAFATSRITNTAFPDGSILLGLGLINAECTQSPSGTCSSIPIILAHEFGHIIDFKNGLSLNGKYKELFADYIAGSYLFHRATIFGWLNINEVAKSFYDKGSYNFNHPDFHGTPQERIDALTAGYYLSWQYYLSRQYLTLPILVNSAIHTINKF